MLRNHVKDGSGTLVRIIRGIVQMILSQRIQIIGNARKACDHLVLRASRIELVGDVIIIKKIMPLVFSVDQQVLLTI